MAYVNMWPSMGKEVLFVYQFFPMVSVTISFFNHLAGKTNDAFIPSRNVVTALRYQALNNFFEIVLEEEFSQTGNALKQSF